MWNLKSDTTELLYKTEKTHRFRKQTYGYQSRKVRRGINQEVGINRYILLYIRQIINKGLLYSTGNSTQYSVINYLAKESEKEQVYVYVYLNHFAVYLILT